MKIDFVAMKNNFGFGGTNGTLVFEVLTWSGRTATRIMTVLKSSRRLLSSWWWRLHAAAAFSL